MKPLSLVFAITLAGLSTGSAAAHADPLETGFSNPPVAAKPQTWWHWMNGNITREGITADLESMARVGIASADIFNVANTSIVNIPAGSVEYLSPEWLDLFHFSATEAQRLGMKLGFTNSAGWSGTGGPWIKPEHSMKVVVWSETEAKGTKTTETKLPQPPSKLGFYRDIAVLAFPSSKSKKDAIALEDIHDLSDKLGRDGRLNWRTPDGDWTVLRIGYTTNGRKIRPAPRSATGLESDKMSREALDIHWKAGIQPVLDKLGPLTGEVLTSILLDSYEAFSHNWTGTMPAEFQQRRGYDMTPYLPVLAGRVVGSREVSDRFSWDCKRTVADLFAANYYDYFTEKCHESGLLFVSEAYGNGGFDSQLAGAKADIPMCEFWVNGGGGGSSARLAASLAHTHGRKIVAAEAFTGRPDDEGRWQNHPGSLKHIGDKMWCRGINSYHFHSIPHQPWPDGRLPGMTMGKYGTHFGRTNTWWEQTPGWMDYIARGQFLLQQGSFVADVLVFAGETPTEDADADDAELRSAGYDYDLCGTDLISRLQVENGLIVLPSGMRYRVLALKDCSHMTPGLAAKVRDLVRAGGVVTGARPSRSPSLENHPQCDLELKTIASEVWGESESKSGVHSFGKGRVFRGRSSLDSLKAMKVIPDFQSTEEKDMLLYIHRKHGNSDVYFVSHQGDETKMVDCTFRVTGRQPELWDPLTGAIHDAGLWQPVEGGTRVTLPLEPKGSVFVVFRNPATPDATTFTNLRNDVSDSSRLPEVTSTPEGARLLVWQSGPLTLDTSTGGEMTVESPPLPNPVSPTKPWTLHFTPDRGAPEQITLPHLQDWTKHPDPGVRHYSGTATYRTDLTLPADFLSKADRVELDLGKVEVLAEVILNGRNLGIVWCKPFRVDITEAAKSGDNTLEIRVVNLWPNRMIGDEEQPPDVKWARMGLKEWPEWVNNGGPRPSSNRVSFATWHHWNKGAPLLPSGLLGPVQVRAGRLVGISR